MERISAPFPRTLSSGKHGRKRRSEEEDKQGGSSRSCCRPRKQGVPRGGGESHFSPHLVRVRIDAGVPWEREDDRRASQHGRWARHSHRPTRFSSEPRADEEDGDGQGALPPALMRPFNGDDDEGTHRIHRGALV
ncbi:hypothetical protein KM043_003457 [Ampulex compressa]|nr:hypothetical protein KM043_003457 [Ampulex compressa]